MIEYDWLYVNSILTNRRITDRIREFNAFTDIEFNPEKSKNCQAHSVAMAVGVLRAGIDQTIPIDRETFLDKFRDYYNSQAYSIIVGWGQK
jgi:hypothetical protein